LKNLNIAGLHLQPRITWRRFANLAISSSWIQPIRRTIIPGSFTRDSNRSWLPGGHFSVSDEEQRGAGTVPFSGKEPRERAGTAPL
jgi:hypothetical protein